MEKEIPVLYKRKEECCGCSACYSVCPKEAILMLADNEGLLPYEMLEFIYIEENQNECFESETLLRHYINMLPLIMACSVKKADKENKSKQNLKGECPEEYYLKRQQDYRSNIN